MEQLKTRVAAFAAMALCCGLAMAIALGAIVVSGAWLVGGVVALVVVGCVGTAAWVAHRARRQTTASH